MPSKPYSNTSLGAYKIKSAFGLILLIPFAIYMMGWSIYRNPYALDESLPLNIQLIVNNLTTVAIPTLSIIGILILGINESRFRAITGWLNQQLKNDKRIFLVLLIAGLILNVRYLFPGYPTISDGLGTVQTIWHTEQYFEAGELRLWFNYSWMGVPVRLGGSILFYTIAVILDFIVGDIYRTARILMWLFNSLSGISIFLYVRKLHSSNWQGAIAAIAYMLVPFHFDYQVFTGRLAMSLFFALLPLPFWALERLFNGWNLQNLALFALTATLPIWAHINFGSIALILLATYTLFRVIANYLATRQFLTFRQFVMLFTGFILAILSASFSLIPTLAQAGLLYTLSDNLKGVFTQGKIYARDAFTFSGTSLPESLNAGYIGISLVVLSILTLVHGFRQRDPIIWSLAAFLLIALYLSLGPRYLPFDLIFQNIPFGYFVYGVKSSGHYLIYVIFILSTLSGLAAATRPRRSSPGLQLLWVILPLLVATPLIVDLSADRANILRILMIIGLAALAAWFTGLKSSQAMTTPRWSLLIGMVLIVELLPLLITTHGYQFTPSYLTGRDAVYAAIRAQPQDYSRVLETNLGNSAYDSVIETGHPCLQCGGHENATLGGGTICRQTANFVIDDITSQGHLSERSQLLLYLTNTAYVITSSLVDGPEVLVDGQGQSAYLLQTAHAPLVASNRVKQAPPGTTLSDLPAQLELDKDHQTANILFTQDTPPPALVNLQPDQPLQVTIKDYLVTVNNTDLVFDLSSPAFIQVSHAYYPYLSVSIDGQPVEFVETSFHMVGLWVEQGEHHLSIRPILSPLEWVFLVINGLSLVIILTGLIIHPPESEPDSPEKA